MSIPNRRLPETIGVWATTSWKDASGWHKGDRWVARRSTRPSNPTADKNDFNETAPSQQATAFGGKFRQNVVNGLLFFEP